MPRLSKALRILNIGFDTAATFLKAEFNISLSSLNSNITYEEYSALMSRFNYDKVLHNIIQKESASRLTHKRRTSRRMKNQKPTIILTDTEKEVFEKVVAADIINQKRIYKNKRENKKGLSLFKQHIKHNKGKSIKGQFKCDICGYTHISGNLYIIGDVHKRVCKFCISGITGKGKGTKLIYTPM